MQVYGGSCGLGVESALAAASVSRIGGIVGAGFLAVNVVVHAYGSSSADTIPPCIGTFDIDRGCHIYRIGSLRLSCIRSS